MSTVKYPHVDALADLLTAQSVDAGAADIVARLYLENGTPYTPTSNVSLAVTTASGVDFVTLYRVPPADSLHPVEFSGTQEPSGEYWQLWIDSEEKVWKLERSFDINEIIAEAPLVPYSLSLASWTLTPDTAVLDVAITHNGEDIAPADETGQAIVILPPYTATGNALLFGVELSPSGDTYTPGDVAATLVPGTYQIGAQVFAIQSPACGTSVLVQFGTRQ